MKTETLNGFQCTREYLNTEKTPVDGKKNLIEENAQSGQRRSQKNDNKEV